MNKDQYDRLLEAGVEPLRLKDIEECVASLDARISDAEQQCLAECDWLLSRYKGQSAEMILLKIEARRARFTLEVVDLRLQRLEFQRMKNRHSPEVR